MAGEKDISDFTIENLTKLLKEEEKIYKDIDKIASNYTHETYVKAMSLIMRDVMIKNGLLDNLIPGDYINVYNDSGDEKNNYVKATDKPMHISKTASGRIGSFMEEFGFGQPPHSDSKSDLELTVPGGVDKLLVELKTSFSDFFTGTAGKWRSAEMKDAYAQLVAIRNEKERENAIKEWSITLVLYKYVTKMSSFLVFEVDRKDPTAGESNIAEKFKFTRAWLFMQLIVENLKRVLFGDETNLKKFISIKHGKATPGTEEWEKIQFHVKFDVNYILGFKDIHLNKIYRDIISLFNNLDEAKEFWKAINEGRDIKTIRSQY